MKKNYFVLVAILFSVVAFAYEVENDSIYYPENDSIYYPKDPVEIFPKRIEIDGIYYEIDGKGYAEVTYHSYMSENNYSYITSVSILSNFTYEDVEYIVEAIGEGAFCNCKSLRSITIPQSINYIKACAFEHCTSLSEVSMSDNINVIECMAFRGCTSLKNITIPFNTREIGNLAFSDTSLETINWNAKEVSNFKLESHIVCGYWSVVGGYLLPFQNCPNITSLQFGDRVQHIPAYLCYEMNNLTSITIPSSVKSIGLNVVNSENNLQEIRFNINDIKDFINSEINRNITHNCKRKLFKDGKEIKEIVIPKEITTIPSYTFSNCASISSFTFHDGVTYIGLDALSGTEWLDNQPNGCVYVGSCLYKYKGDMPENSHVEIKEGTYQICNNAFADCLGLTSIVIPQSVSSIEYGAFENCYFLKSIKCYAPDNFYSWIFQINNKPNLIELVCPVAWLNDFNEYEQYPKKLEILTITEGEVTDNIYDFIKYSKKTLHTLDLTEASNSEIEDLAFKGCYALENVSFPKNIKIIGYESFSECTKLKTLEIPSTVVEIKERAFENCRSITSLTFAEGSNLKTIGSWAFYNNHSLTHVEIPEGVEIIGDIAFYGCDFLEELILPSTIISIGENGFAQCSKVQRMSVNAPMPPDIKSNTFDNVSRDIVFTIPKESYQAYAEHEYWSEFVKSTNIDNITEDIDIFVQNGELHIQGEIKTDYQIYNALGSLVYSGNQTIHSLPNGIYLIKINGKTQKIYL